MWTSAGDDTLGGIYQSHFLPLLQTGRDGGDQGPIIPLESLPALAYRPPILAKGQGATCTLHTHFLSTTLCYPGSQPLAV